MSDMIDSLFRTGYALTVGTGRSDEFKRGVVETIASTLELTGPLGRLAVAERLNLNPRVLYPAEYEAVAEGG